MNIIFQIDGGLGKCIMATAVCECIKHHHPDDKLIVVSGYPEVFLDNPWVDRAYAFGYYNTASGYRSSSLGSIDSTSSATYSSTLGKNASAYLYGQNALASGQFSSTGDSQSSTLIARRAATALTTGSTFDLSLDGTGTTNLVIPATSTSWAIKVQYVARVGAVVGSTGAIVLGDSKTQTQEIGVRNVGGTLSILTGSPNSNIPLEDPSMSTAQMSYSVSGGNALAMTFAAPIYAGGGSINIKVVATLTITEVK